MLTKNSFYEDKISDRYTRLTINKSKRRVIDFTYKTSYEQVSSFTHPNVKKKINKKFHKELIFEFLIKKNILNI